MVVDVTNPTWEREVNETKQLEVLNRWYASTDKPEGTRALDVSFIARLILRKADEKPVQVADSTWSLELGCSESSIRDAATKLENIEAGFGWIQMVRGKRKGVASKYTLVLDRLPLSAELKRTILTDEMRTFTRAFMQKLRAFNPRRKFYQNTDQRWAFRFQKLLNRLDGDLKLLGDLTDFALIEPSFRGFVVKDGPKAMLKSWKKLRALHAEHVRRMDETKAAQTIAAQHDADVDALFSASE